MEKLKILIVEDEALIAFQLRRGLSRAGYEVCVPATSAEEAIDLAQKEKPDWVLMDIGLPGPLNGIDAARQIGVSSTAKIIFATGYQDPGLKQALALNPAAYLNKPIEWRDIEAAIRSSQAAEKGPD